MGEEYNINDITTASGYSFVASDNYFSNNNNLWAYNTISANNTRSVNIFELDDKIIKLESDIKDLKKIIANLSTVLYTYLGNEKKKNFYESNK